MQLNKFVFKKILDHNPTEKTVYLLGGVQGKQGEAILILSPKISSPQNNEYKFDKIKTIFTNDIYQKFQANLQTTYDIQTIFPITEKHKLKYQHKQKQICRQSAQKYQKDKQELLKRQLAHIGWVNNIILGKAEIQRVLFSNQDFMILPDFKFHDLTKVDNLHLLCLFKSQNLYSIRDLTKQHILLLEAAYKQIDLVLHKNFNFGVNKCRVYFHYPPTFYRLHLHIQILSLDSSSCNVERCHELMSVIQNLKICGQYYKKVSLNVVINH